jgi:hypothetical protein
MKKVIKFLSIAILFLSTTLSAQQVYDIKLENKTLSIVKTLNPKSEITIKTIGKVQFELYDLKTKGDRYVTNYFVPQHLDGNYLLEIKDDVTTVKFNIKNGKITLIK